MNREEFMRRDALDYYRDYLEEAGDSAEEAMREFGSPERIASIIRSDIQGNLADGGEFTDTGYTDERFREPNYQLARREQGEPESSDGAAPGNDRQPAYRDAVEDQNVAGSGNTGGSNGADPYYYGNIGTGAGQSDSRTGGYSGNADQSGAAGRTGNPGQPGVGGHAGNPGQPGTAGRTGNPGQPGAAGHAGNSGQPGAPGRPGSGGQAAKVLWIILAIIGAVTVLPALLGFAGGAFGILVAIVVLLLVLVFLTAILTFVFLVAGVAVVAAGIAAVFADPLDGVVCIGVGLVMLAIGLVGVVLSVLIYGKLLPWLFRGAIDGLNGMLHRKERTA